VRTITRVSAQGCKATQCAPVKVKMRRGPSASTAGYLNLFAEALIGCFADRRRTIGAKPWQPSFWQSLSPFI
jgi:hypothetical protein